MQPILTILIPAKHETDTIEAVLDSLRKSVQTPHRILVVNDTDARDRTATIVRTYMRKHKHISLLHRISKTGTFGSALSLGLGKTVTPYVVPVMADLCDDPKDIDRMVKKIREGWDVVCASRYMSGGRKAGGPWLQSLFSRFVCTSMRLLTGIPTWDVSNAYKMYKTKIAKSLTIQSDSGVEASMELVLQAYFHGHRITEMPTFWKGRTRGHSKFRFFERMPKYLRLYLWALRQNAYLRTRSMSPQPGTGS